MVETEFERLAIKDMDKCAIIYRSDPVSFIYVCCHCGASFCGIETTLQHIDSHFQLVEVTIDENSLKTECKDSEKSAAIVAVEVRHVDLDIKIEVMESEEGCGNVVNSSINGCQLCDSVFPSKFLFRTHLLKEHFREPALECGKCGRKFKRDVSLENHLRQHIERFEVDWTCTGDGIREPSPKIERSENLAVEQLVETQPEKREPKKKSKTAKARSKRKTRQISSYLCHKCSETFSTLSDLKSHLGTHSTEDMLQLCKCKDCKSYFGSAFDLRLHVLEAHLSEKQFKCSTCSVEFKKDEKSQLENHLESHLANDSANWTHLLQGIYINGKDVATHEEITTSRESSCESCGEKFYLKSNLDEHIRCMHSNNEHESRCPQLKNFEFLFIISKCCFPVLLRSSTRTSTGRRNGY